MINRYSRQIIFPEIGPDGQNRLKNSLAVVIGCGALGTVTASALVRAGIGKIRIVDRDYLEYHNLQRQLLFDEDDIRGNLPKAIAAEKHLRKVNSEVIVEGVVADVNYHTVEKLVEGADVIVDGLDNYETRLLINDVALKHGIPWVYGGAIGASGMTMTIIPHRTACFRCIFSGQLKQGQILTCDTAGVISPAPWTVGAIQAAEVLKILVKPEKINSNLLIIDLWRNEFSFLKVKPYSACPACRGVYEFLAGKSGTRATSLCGQNAIQVLPTQSAQLSFNELAQKLKLLGIVDYNEYMLTFKVDSHEILVFPDARAIIKNTSDEALARGLYAKYIGA